MSRLATCFQTLNADGRKALIPYITAGDPAIETTEKLMHALVAAGADIIEIGVPFSDPMADGPVIQAACERALAKGTQLPDILDMVARFRQQDTDTPIVLMGYLNPVESMGYESFAKRASQAGVDGVLLVDLSAEEAAEPAELFYQHGLDPVFLVAPTSPISRIKRIAESARGYLYYVSFKGVTGASRLNVDEVAERVGEIRAHAQLPVAVGFGISNAQAAAEVSAVADAVVVGSALVSKIAELCHDEASLLQEVPAILQSMRQAMDANQKDAQS